MNDDGKRLEVPFVEDDDVHPPIVGTPLGGIVGRDRNGIREPGHLETFLVYSNIGQIMQNIYRAGAGKFPIRLPGTGWIDGDGVCMAFDPKFPPGDLVGR